jgi:Arc/MetJ family transcription regulator
MRTNIVLEDSLVKEALKYSGAKTKKELIHQALEEFVKNRRRRNLLDLAGKIEFAEGYDYKSLREGKRQ